MQRGIDKNQSEDVGVRGQRRMGIRQRRVDGADGSKGELTRPKVSKWADGSIEEWTLSKARRRGRRGQKGVEKTKIEQMGRPGNKERGRY